MIGRVVDIIIPESDGGLAVAERTSVWLFVFGLLEGLVFCTACAP